MNIWYNKDICVLKYPFFTLFWTRKFFTWDLFGHWLSSTAYRQTYLTWVVPWFSLGLLTLELQVSDPHNRLIHIQFCVSLTSSQSRRKPMTGVAESLHLVCRTLWQTLGSFYKVATPPPHFCFHYVCTYVSNEVSPIFLLPQYCENNVAYMHGLHWICTLPVFLTVSLLATGGIVHDFVVFCFELA